MAENTKAELIAQLDRARGEFGRQWGEFRQDIDVPQHLRRTFGQHKTAWIGAAALFGWLLSRLPARKKTVKVLVDDRGHKIKSLTKGGLFFTLGKMAFSTLRPVAAALATRQLKVFVENRMKR